MLVEGCTAVADSRKLTGDANVTPAGINVVGREGEKS